MNDYGEKNQVIESIIRNIEFDAAAKPELKRDSFLFLIKRNVSMLRLYSKPNYIWNELELN